MLVAFLCRCPCTSRCVRQHTWIAEEYTLQHPQSVLQNRINIFFNIYISDDTYSTHISSYIKTHTHTHTIQIHIRGAPLGIPGRYFPMSVLVYEGFGVQSECPHRLAYTHIQHLHLLPCLHGHYILFTIQVPISFTSVLITLILLQDPKVDHS